MSGERQPSALPAAPLLAALARDALDLLGVLLRERPASVTALVALTGRAQPNVSRSLQLLARHRLVRLVREGRGVRPEPIAGAVRVDLASGTYDTPPPSTAAAPRDLSRARTSIPSIKAAEKAGGAMPLRSRRPGLTAPTARGVTHCALLLARSSKLDRDFRDSTAPRKE